MLNQGGSSVSEHTNTLSRRAFIGTAAAVGAVTMAAPNIAFGATAAEKQAEADAFAIS